MKCQEMSSCVESTEFCGTEQGERVSEGDKDRRGGGVRQAGGGGELRGVWAGLVETQGLSAPMAELF